MKLIPIVVLIYVTLALSGQKLEESKVHIGVLALQTNSSQEKLAGEMTKHLEAILTDMGFYQVYSPHELEKSLLAGNMKMPRHCNDPRCVVHVGRILKMDRMIFGTVDVTGGRVGISVTLLDVGLQQTIEQISITGEPDASASDVLRAAVSTLHGIGDTLITYPYFGHDVDNKKQFIYSSSAVVGSGLIYAALNHLIEREGGNVYYEYRDEKLSGIASSANQIPMFARPAALANAYVAASDDAYGVLYNPAGMAWVGGAQAALTYQYRFGLDNLAATYVNMATRELGFGQALMYSGDREFGLTELYFVTAAAYRINHLFMSAKPVSVGMSVKVASSRVRNLSPDSPAGSSFGAGIDLGLLWEMSEKIRYGLLLRDVPVINRWKNVVTGERYYEANAATMHMGGSFQAGYSTFLIAEGQLPLYDDQPWKMAGGIEHELYRIISLRIGLQKEIMNADPTPWKITGGVGVRIETEPFLGSVTYLDCSYEYNTLNLFDVLNVSLRIGF